jgi:SAM-dependent methyltransferase
VFARIGLEALADMAALQLSPDIGVDPGWFRIYELSEFGGANSLDLEAIDRPDAGYDLVICNHVLEHVANDRQGYRELLRIIRPEGFLQFTVPSPHSQAQTVDWGYARPESNYHYRGYGADLVERFRDACPEARMLVVEAIDPVTGRADFIYLSTRSESRFRSLRTRLSTTGSFVDGKS